MKIAGLFIARLAFILHIRTYSDERGICLGNILRLSTGGCVVLQKLLA